MSKHRNRNIDYDDYYDDYDDDDDYYDDSAYGSSPMSPSSKQFLYHGGRGNGSAPKSSMWDLMKRSGALPKADIDNGVNQVIDALKTLGCATDAMPNESEIGELLRKNELDVELVAALIRDSIEQESHTPRIETPAENGVSGASHSISGSGVFQMDDWKTNSSGSVPLAPTPTRPSPNLEQMNILGEVRSHSRTGGITGVFELKSPSPPVVAAKEVQSAPVTPSLGSKISSPPPSVTSPPLRKVPQRSAAKNREAEKLVTERIAANAAAAAAAKDRNKKQASAPSPSPYHFAPSSGKPHYNLAVIGHVDAGKSTINGHLFCLLGNVSAKARHKNERESEERGKASFSFAWVFDQHEEERDRGVTIDVGVKTFETEHRRVTLLDAPGHRDFVPNMISGTSQADLAILVIDSQTGEFEAGFLDDGQTKEHAMLARSLGVLQLVVAVNKMDSCNYSQQRYDEIVAQLRTFLKSAGYRDKQVQYLPVSGFKGENLIERKDAALSWYSGPTLLEIIDTYNPRSLTDECLSTPFRLCVTDIYKVQGMGGLTVGGKVESGCLLAGDRVMILPLGEIGTVKSVLGHNESLLVAVPGDNVDVGLTGIEQGVVHVGHVMCDPERPIPVVSKIRAQIITFSPLEIPITKGHQVVFHSQSVHEPAEIRKLLTVIDRASGEVTRRKPRFLTESVAATVEIRIQRPVCAEKYADLKAFGRFMLRKSGRTIAAGIILDLLS